jgi:CheY-like chemotaxis protein
MAADTVPTYMPSAPRTAAGPILVVDDEPDIRTVLRMCLESEGYSVCIAGNGREALERIVANRPAVILLDLNMPIMSGWDVLAELRTRQCTIPVLFMSAGRTAKVEAARHGVAGWVPKPFDLDDLLATIARAVQLSAAGGAT